MRSGSLPRNSPNAERLHPTTPGAVVGAGEASPTAPQNPNPAAGDEIPEADVLFDDATGHAHAGSGGSGTPITLLGDVTGTNAASVVGKLQTHPVGAGAPNVGDLLIWDGSAWTPTAPTVGNNAFEVGGWLRTGIAGASPGQVPIHGALTGLVALADGTVTGIGVSLSGDVGGAGSDYTAELYLNGVATGQTVGPVGAAGTQDSAVNFSVSVAFIRTDKLTFYDTHSGAPNNVDATLYMTIEFT
jgi:hypothetical protein